MFPFFLSLVINGDDAMASCVSLASFIFHWKRIKNTIINKYFCWFFFSPRVLCCCLHKEQPDESCFQWNREFSITFIPINYGWFLFLFIRILLFFNLVYIRCITFSTPAHTHIQCIHTFWKDDGMHWTPIEFNMKVKKRV